MVRLHFWIGSSSSFNSHLRMYSSSKQCTKRCAISRTVLIRGESSDNSNPLLYSFRNCICTCPMHAQTITIVSLFRDDFFRSMLLFNHIWRIFLRTDNYWLSRSYYLDKFKIWTCALLEISTISSLIIYHSSTWEGYWTS